MKLRLFCLTFISAVVVAAALASAPAVTNAGYGVKPLAAATPKKINGGSQVRIVKPRDPHVAVGDVNGDPRDARRRSRTHRKHRKHHH